jgi:phospholipase C
VEELTEREADAPRGKGSGLVNNAGHPVDFFFEGECRPMNTYKPLLTRVSLTLSLLALLTVGAESRNSRPGDPAEHFHTDSPIKHVVVIFQENVSFDHYFATYPHALNTTAGEPKFFAKPGTPTVNNLESAGLLTSNPNSRQPFRLGRKQCATDDMDHEYNDQQLMFHGGLMDKFVENNVVDGSDHSNVMAYFDGNTVTAIWNYAQHFAMSDNSFGTTFGPSTPGAINLISGQTHGAIPADFTSGGFTDTVDGSIVGDPQPTGDLATSRDNVTMSAANKNVGNLLNAKGITWGWFQGGFRAQDDGHGGRTFINPGPKHTAPDPDPTLPPAKLHTPKVDYIPHHEGFQYYSTGANSTANLNHLGPTGPIGQTDQANHQYDLIDFWDAVAAHNIPAVSYLKAPGYQDGHAQYSDPLSEQTFLVETINKLQNSPEWESMLIIIAYDDSDGWYDHVMGPIVKQSNTFMDGLLGPGNSGTPKPGEYNGRCGYGPRLPLLLISPFAKKNFVDHSITDQSSILRFIEDNWDLGRIGDQSYDAIAGKLDNMLDFRHGPHPHKLILDPSTGLPAPE